MTTYYHAASARHLSEGNPFTLDDIQYPANWLALASPEDLELLGAERVVTVGQPEDARYFDVQDVLVGAVRTIVNTLKDPERVRQAQLASIAAISPRQIRMALTRAGLRTAVEAAVAAGDQDLKDWYEFSTAFERTNEQVAAMGAALGVTEQQLDALWALGVSL